MTIERKIAGAVSLVTHPLLAPTYAILLMLNIPAYFSLGIPAEALWRIAGLVFLTSCLIPVFLILMLHRMGKVTSLLMSKREERILPYTLTVVCFYVTYIVLKKAGLPAIYLYLMSGVTLLAFLTLVVNFFWKISSHMIATGAITGMLVGLSFFLGSNLGIWILAAILLSGITGYARLALDAHSPAEVYAGYGLGLILFLIQMLVL